MPNKKKLNKKKKSDSMSLATTSDFEKIIGTPNTPLTPEKQTDLVSDFLDDVSSDEEMPQLVTALPGNSQENAIDVDSDSLSDRTIFSDGEKEEEEEIYDEARRNFVFRLPNEDTPPSSKFLSGFQKLVKGRPKIKKTNAEKVFDYKMEVESCRSDVAVQGSPKIENPFLPRKQKQKKTNAQKVFDHKIKAQQFKSPSPNHNPFLPQDNSSNQSEIGSGKSRDLDCLSEMSGIGGRWRVNDCLVTPRV